MNIGPWQLLIVALVVLVLFGRGRISEMMGDFGKGIRSFKQGMNEDERKDAPRIAQQHGEAAAAPVPPVTPAATDGAEPLTAPETPLARPATAEQMRRKDHAG
ncbi:twin-arginine translocase TatA/TatE family subunit [Croceicoccus sp. F390]|uniref:Sec-independent protein translocase protein TatA n=1 Tax=Croceicoccus esteveae TaxID=3075597 RepID=A0ABU2ZGG2_9SPHN|nr:twin-arginine translocase TatA/TatE family subunit [Croceicoccus sp. F390]MDT0575681.1 twin-arginine translocase TatA/TatE family subunit [Croceicoccus sp. F390]